MSTHIFSQGLEGLSTSDQELFCRFGCGPAVPVPYSTVHAAFESIVDSYPAVIAARYGNKSLSYLELETASNRLAHFLIAEGLQPRQKVCLVAQRSLENLVAILAVLKAGCQYVPIDGGVVSEEALNHIFTDVGARYILCLSRYYDKVRRFADRNALIMTMDMDVSESYSSTRPNVSVAPTDGVYAIYTSGSTGTPKGVDVMHSNVTNALLLEPANLGIKVGSKVAQVLNVSFDMAAWETLACLMNGGTLHMRGSDWKATLKEVDVLVATPSILGKYRRSDFLNIKTVVTGGERCPQSVADEWAEGTCYYNICGPTEITILNSAHRHVPGLPLTIGKPLPNTTCYILDEDEKPVAIGAKGSMWVGGAGVTRGYINLPELTAQRYKLDKFKNDGSIIFNTGDLVSWTKDGSMDIFGRKDDQVKVKGFRIELDGVTNVVEKFPGVLKASTLLFNNKLYGFYAAPTPLNEEDLSKFAHVHLPYYSVPEVWVQMAEMSLTPNGKVDRKKLLATITTHKRQDSGYSNGMPKPAPIHPSPLSSDPEKGQIVVYSDSSDSSVSSKPSSICKEADDSLPSKNGYHGQRWFRHRGFIVYRKFFSVIALANIAIAIFMITRRNEATATRFTYLATATASNLCVAVLMRSEPVVNLLFTVACSVPTSVPLAIRRHFARIFHIGGIHSGCALAAIMWFIIFTIEATIDMSKPVYLRTISTAPFVLSWIIVAIFIAMASLSYPTIRAKYHNLWECTHRFGGWTSLILIWIQTGLAIQDFNVDSGEPQWKAYVQSPPIWLLAVITAAIIFPWLHLRKVPVRSEVLSNHAIRLWFDYTTPVVGTSVRLAERPLVDWHGFATITNQGPNARGYSLIVSRAGDFTGRTISRAPTHIWVRGIPACGVLRIAPLFKSIVLVATGSGIGPCLAVILARKVPCRILWTAPNAVQTFGKEIVKEVMTTDPNALIWNTRTQGKPDMSKLTYKLYKESGAEAVCVISNKKFTTKIVYDMEARGIPAYGAIFDS